MRQKLFLLLLLAASIPALAGTPKVRGTVVDATTGAPVKAPQSCSATRECK